MDDYKKAAAMVFQRKGRFVEGYYPEEELLGILNIFFGNEELLHKHGLTYFYNQFKSYVTHNNCIGLVILCSKSKPQDKYYIASYQPPNNIKTKLYSNTICKTILEEYFTEQEIKDLCFKTPNFKIYYKGS